MAQANMLANRVGQGDPHTNLGLSAPGSKQKVWAYLVPCSSSQMDTIRMSRDMVWYGMVRERQNGPYSTNRGISEEAREEGQR